MTNKAPTSTTEGDQAPPPFSRTQVEYLQRVYPDRLPLRTDISDRELGALFGEQRVIKHLLGILHQQDEDNIPNVL